MTANYASRLPVLELAEQPDFMVSNKIRQTMVSLVKSIPLPEYRDAVRQALAGAERSLDTSGVVHLVRRALFGETFVFQYTFPAQSRTGGSFSYPRSVALSDSERAFDNKVKKALEGLAAEGEIVRKKNRSNIILWASKEVDAAEKVEADRKALDHAKAKELAVKLDEIFDIGRVWVSSGETKVLVPANVLDQLLECWNEVHGS